MWEKIKAFLTSKNKSLSEEELKELETIVGGDDKKEDKEDKKKEEDKQEDKQEDKKVEDKKVEDKVIEILQEGWLDDKGNINLEKINDETLKNTIKGLVDKVASKEEDNKGFNPAQPNQHTGYTSGMGFDEALDLEYSNINK